MAVFNCPDCGKTVSTSAPACPHCGRPAGAAVVVSAPEPARAPLRAAIAAMQTAPKHNCPRCGEEATARYRSLYVVAEVILFPVGLLCLLLPRVGTCTKCHHIFDVPSTFRIG